jgi:hypothetical protein
LGKIKILISPVERAHWLKELSLRTKIKEKVLAEEMEQLKIQINTDKIQINTENIHKNHLNNLTQSAISRRELIAQRLASLLVVKQNLFYQLGEYLNYLPDDYLAILKYLTEHTELREKRLIELLNLIHLRSSFEFQIFDEEKLENEFQELIQQLRLEYLKEKRQGLIRLIKDSEERGDEDELANCLKEFDRVLKMMENNR